MNIVQMQERVMFYVDRVRSARFRNYEKDSAVNIAIQRFVYDRYDNIKNPKTYSFEFLQRVRDDLRTIVKTKSITPVVTLNGALSQYPSDYMHEIGFVTVIDGLRRSSRSATYNEITVIDQNSFEKPTPEFPVHYEDETGINIEFGTGTITDTELSYIKIPDTVLVSDAVLTAGPNTVAPGLTYYVQTGTITNNAVTYSAGQTFVAVGTVTTGLGTFINIVNCNLPENTHEEICKIAAEILIGSVEDYNKSKFLDIQNQKS